MNKELQKIANTLVLYSYQIRNDGLLNGKMGIILFLYRYADYSACKYYRELSDDLMDNVLASVSRIPVSFEDGLIGIGWAVNYLIKRGFVDGNPNEILQDVDKKVLSNYRYNPETSILGQGIYLIERLKDNPSNVDFEKRIIECLDFCDKGIKEYKGPISLYHINSILFFLLNIENNFPNNTKIGFIKNHLYENLKSVYEDGKFDDVDLYIFKRLFDEIDYRQTNGWNVVLSLQTSELSWNLGIETMIRISWQEMLYFGNSKLKEIPFEAVSRFINKKQESLSMDDLRGLVGLGNLMLSTNTGVMD